MPAVVLIKPVEVLHVLRFMSDIKCFGSCGLHAVGELETFDARAQLGFGRGVSQVVSVQLGQQVELRSLGGTAHACRLLEIVDGRALGS